MSKCCYHPCILYSYMGDVLQFVFIHEGFFAISAKAQKLADHDLLPALGGPNVDFWSVQRNNYNAIESGRDSACLGIMLYGDEADALGTSFMTLGWMSEHTLFPSNPSLSRFLITICEKERYAMSASGNNLTLQCILGLVVKSLNWWKDHRIGGFYAALSSLKGDWKFLDQALNLKRKYSTDAMCFRCLATKSMQRPYTDISSTASWRTTVDAEDPWPADEPPALTELHNFRLAAVAIDVTHTWHLGLARDVIGSLMVILLRTPIFFPGRTIQERLLSASRLAKDYARQVAHRAFPRKWLFTRARLGLKTNTYMRSFMAKRGWQQFCCNGWKLALQRWPRHLMIYMLW